MNQEESVARGCALQAAILSPLYKVRDFKVEDFTPNPILVGWMGSAADSQAQGEGEEAGADETRMEGGEGEYKTATVFPAGSQMNVLKMLTFYRKGPFEVKAEYADTAFLPLGTPKELGTFRIELAPQTETRKIKVRAKLSLHGIFTIEGAQLVEEEEYEETIKEKREIPEAEGEAAAAVEGEAADGEKKEGEEKKEEKKEKKYEWVEVKKMKKRTKRTDLKVVASGTPGIPTEELQKLMDQESAIQSEMADIIETDERRNDLESYILTMRDKVSEGNEYGAFITSADREAFCAELTKAEDWLYDNFDATKTQYIDKIGELKQLGDPVVWRCKEDGMRTEWMQAVSGTANNYRSAAQNPGDKYDHIAPEKLQSIVKACDDLEAWLKDLSAKQSALQKSDKPVLLCADMEKKNTELAVMADTILKEPKPAPPKEEKKEEEAPKPAEDGAEAKPAEAPKEETPANDVD